MSVRTNSFPLSLHSALAAVCVLLLASVVQAAPVRPNIVLIISDDQAWTDYGFMGHDAIQTPNLDKLAAQSALFRRGYVPTALCRPSLATLATGLYAHQHRITGNDPAGTEANKAHAAKAGKATRALLISHFDQTKSLGGWLGKAGYLSHQSGKWWEGSYGNGGFTHGMSRGYPQPNGRHGDDGLTIGREGMQPVFDFMDIAVEQDKQFFIWYAPFLPHRPHDPPQRLLDNYTAEGRPPAIAKYYAMCEWFDETCGQLLGRIDDLGIRDDTIVIYVTDNGWIQSEDGGYAARSKRSPNEGGTRTPIMFRWPGVITPVDRTELISSIDIVPTVLAAVGQPVPDNLPGLNLLPALRDKSPIERNQIFGEAFAHDIADIDNPAASLLYRWVIEGDWKLLLTYDGRQGNKVYRPADFRPQLFNLKADPHEHTNLAAKHPKLVARLADRISEWWPVNERNTVVEWSDKPVDLKQVRALKSETASTADTSGDGAVAEVSGKPAADEFVPDQSRLLAAPPDDAIVLLDRNGTHRFLGKQGGKINWPIENGELVSTSGGHGNHIVSQYHFRDADIHVEFMTAQQGQGNSGIYIHGNYELQIVNSKQGKPLDDTVTGAIYGFSKPLIDAAKPQGEWQVYDIRYRAPRRNSGGEIVEKGSITAWLNGKKVQDRARFGAPRSVFHPFRYKSTPYLATIWQRQKKTSTGPVFLQDHGSPARFRNIWIRPLDKSAFLYGAEPPSPR